MEITVFQLGSLGTNCYIVREGKNCAIIDPGDAGEALADWLDNAGLTPEAVLLTHGHYDHVGGVEALRNRYAGLPVYVHEADTHLTADLSRGLQWTHHYNEGDILTVGGVEFRVLHTPGHTPGSVCLAVENVIFSGDTLFAGSCGRTDIGGDWVAIQKSLKRLSAMEADFTIFPGHGESTTLAAEKRYNPYMR